MIDLETLSTNPNATILTVGGVKFDPYTSVEPAQGMYFRVDVDSQTEMGRDVMQDTLDWWGRQDPEIMEEAPWLLIFPGSLFAMTLFSLNFLGDGLRDALDPRASKD